MTDVDLAHAPVAGDPMARCPECGELLRFGGPCARATSAHNPQRLLDLANVEVGSWVSWKGAIDPAEARGGIVIGIDRVGDPETGETYRLFQTVKAGLQGVPRYDRLVEDNVGSIDPPDSYLARSTWRAVSGWVAKRRGTALPEELRAVETVYRLMRSAT